MQNISFVSKVFCITVRKKRIEENRKNKRKNK